VACLCRRDNRLKKKKVTIPPQVPTPTPFHAPSQSVDKKGKNIRDGCRLRTVVYPTRAGAVGEKRHGYLLREYYVPHRSC
jgi:hypothetical protein